MLILSPVGGGASFSVATSNLAVDATLAGSCASEVGAHRTPIPPASDNRRPLIFSLSITSLTILGTISSPPLILRRNLLHVVDYDHIHRYLLRLQLQPHLLLHCRKD